VELVEPILFTPVICTPKPFILELLNCQNDPSSLWDLSGVVWAHQKM